VHSTPRCCSTRANLHYLRFSALTLWGLLLPALLVANKQHHQQTTNSKKNKEVHHASERQARGVNVVLGLDSSEDAWRRLDRRVNRYPAQRSFTAIGSAGDSFEAAMVDAVASVVGHVSGACVSQKHSARGAYVSVTIGPVLVRNSDEVVQVYERMRSDARVRYFL
jgi:putative lipoic acid-binding regulatory protein